MKLRSVFYKRNLMLIYLIISILFSLTMVSVPVKSDPYETRLYIRESPPPDGYIPGVSVGEDVNVTVDIESPSAWDNTSNGIVGYTFDVHVDPNVLEPVGVDGAKSGYWLYEFCLNYSYFAHFPQLLSYPPDNVTGDIEGIAEFIMGYLSLGVGAGGNSTTNWGRIGDPVNGLVKLQFKSKSLTAYTKIDISNAHWVRINASYIPGHPGEWRAEKIPFDVVDDGHYNQPGVYHTLTVESTPIDGIDFTVDTTTYTTNFSDSFPEGAYIVTMPSTWTNGADQYSFVEWEDTSTNPVRAISLTSNLIITATYVYVPPVYLTVKSTPIDGIDFTIDTTAYTTNATAMFLQENYVVTMPDSWMVGTDQYRFVEWEDTSTNPVRAISLTSNMIITATYEHREAGLVGHKAWPEHHHFDISKHGNTSVPDPKGTPGYQTLYAKVKNLGEVDVTVKVEFEVVKVTKIVIETDNVTLTPGAPFVLLEANFSGLNEYPWGASDIGKWKVTATCLYYNPYGDDWVAGVKTKAFGFAVVA